MFFHFLRLLGASWHSFRESLGTTTLGFIAPLVVSVISIVATLYEILRRQGKDAMLKRWREDAVIALRLTIVVTVAVYAPILFYEGLVKTVYGDHMALAEANRVLWELNENLKRDLGQRRHTIVTTDPVFPNIIYVLQAFQSYRLSLKGAPCVIYFTAVPDSMALASTIAQFSNSVSGCSTFGPDVRTDPDDRKMAMEEMIPGVIVVHSQRDDREAVRLQENLGNQVQTRLSYTPPQSPNRASMEVATGITSASYGSSLGPE